jgi:hypothetical protein
MSLWISDTIVSIPDPISSAGISLLPGDLYKITLLKKNIRRFAFQYSRPVYEPGVSTTGLLVIIEVYGVFPKNILLIT